MKIFFLALFGFLFAEVIKPYFLSFFDVKYNGEKISLHKAVAKYIEEIKKNEVLMWIHITILCIIVIFIWSSYIGTKNSPPIINNNLYEVWSTGKNFLINEIQNGTGVISQVSILFALLGLVFSLLYLYYLLVIIIYIVVMPIVYLIMKFLYSKNFTKKLPKIKFVPPIYNIPFIFIIITGISSFVLYQFSFNSDSTSRFYYKSSMISFVISLVIKIYHFLKQKYLFIILPFVKRMVACWHGQYRLYGNKKSKRTTYHEKMIARLNNRHK